MVGLLPGRAWAADEFVVNEQGILTRYRGAGGDIIIPGTVTSIGDRAFIYNTTITSVSIPGSVTSIGEEAFRDCAGLVSISIPDSVTSIGEDAFYDCAGLVSVSVPASVTSIGTGAFFGCTGLISAGPIGGEYSYKFGWTNEIPANAFFGCSGLTCIDIPGSVTSIGSDAFYDCTSLTSIDIPDGVTTIGNSAFWEAGLNNIDIPDSVTNIGNRAFWECASLVSVDIPDSVQVIGYQAFADCSSLTSIDIPAGITTISSHMFSGCTNLAKINMPDSVTTIEDHAFGGCINLTSINIPNGVTNIWYSAFSGCNGLTSVTIPDSVTSVGPDAFSGTSLADIYYTGTMEQWNVMDKGSGCFGGRPNITIHYNSTGPSDPDNPGEDIEARNISGVLRSGDGCRVLWQCSYQVGKDAQPKNGKIKIFTSSTDTVDEELFLYNESVESGFPYPWELAPYNLPKSAITSIQIVGEEHKQLRVPANAFRGYSQLKQVTLDCVSAVDNSAFADCTLLQSAAFSDTVKHIGANAFQNTDLRTIKLGRNVETIGENAFAGCSNLKIRCYKDSVAHQYAVENSIPYEWIVDPGSEKVVVPFLIADRTIDMEINWAPDMLFSRNSSSYSNNLAIAGLVLSSAAEDGEEQISNVMEKMGFSSAVHLRYGETENDVHLPAMSLGMRTVNIGGEGKTLVVCVVRGTKDGEDILTDIASLLDGFSGAGEYASSQVRTYLNGIYAGGVSKDDIILFVTGHSLGAAVAGHIAKGFTSELTSNQIFAYTYATPRNQSTSQSRLSNIYNIINIYDKVPYIPPNFRAHIGIDHSYSSKNNPNFNEKYKELSGVEPDLNPFNLLARHLTGTYMALLLTNKPLSSSEEFGHRFVRILCPVDVEVYNAKGNLVGRIVGNEVDSSIAEDDVFITVIGDKKYIYLLTDDAYSFNFIGTNNGTMEYSVQDFAIDGTLISEKDYSNVTLEAGKAMISNVGGTTNTPDVPLYVLGTSGNPEKEVLPDGNGTEIPITKPVDPDKPDEPTPAIYTITFDPNGGSVTPTSAKTVADGKLTALPIPIRAGYSFQGWYTAISGGSVVTTDAVFAQNTTVYAHWNYNGSSGPNGDSTGGDVTYPSDGNSSGSGTSTPNYSITAPSAPGGTVTISSKSAAMGTTVTITVKPDAGYELLSLTVIDGSNKEIPLTDQGNGKYTFVMPVGKVTVSAEFQAVQPTTVPTPEVLWGNPFTDVSEESWYYDAVKFVSENGLMNGISNDVFAPDANLFRAMLAQILYNKENKPAITNNSLFTDVAGSAWYADAVTWAAAQGIVNGYGGSLFGPDDSITREQLAVMLWRYAGEPTAISKELHFSDAKEVSNYAISAINWAVENGVINGKGDNILDPKGFATRAQVAQMLMNYLKS